MSLAELSVTLDEIQTELNEVKVQLQAAVNNDNGLLAAIQRVRNLETELEEAEKYKQYWFEKYQQLKGAVTRLSEEANEVFSK